MPKKLLSTFIFLQLSSFSSGKEWWENLVEQHMQQLFLDTCAASCIWWREGALGLVESKLQLIELDSSNMSQNCEPLFKWWFELVLAQEKINIDKYPLKDLNNFFFIFAVNLSEYHYCWSDCKWQTDLKEDKVSI